MNAIEQYRALLVELGITADVAQYNGWRLRPDYIHIPHHALRGGIQSYRSAQVASRLLLNGQFEPHRATKLYFSKHPTRPLKPIDYLQDYSEPLILCDNLIDTIYLQSQLAQSAIQAQCVYIKHNHFPKTKDFPLATVEQQKRIYYTRHTSQELINHLRANGAICHALKHSSKHPDALAYVRNGGSIADTLSITVKASNHSNVDVSLNKVQDKAEKVMEWLDTLPRQVYSLTDLHNQFIHYTGIEIGKTQLSRILTNRLPMTSRRLVHEYIPAISWKTKSTMAHHMLIAVRQNDYWQTSTDKQWLAEYRQQYNTKTRIGT